jgi:putative ABC transport system substrate-binding protein
MPVVGFINAASAENYKRQVATILKGLAQNGYVDGQNVKVEYRWAAGQYDQMPALIAELLGRQSAGTPCLAAPPQRRQPWQRPGLSLSYS